MRRFIDIITEAYVMPDFTKQPLQSSSGPKTRLYHGGANPKPHDKMFLTTDPDFASNYGSVYIYEVALGTVFNTLDEASIEPFLPLTDPYDDEAIETMSEYRARDSDTWEMIEHVIDSIPGDSVLITEGGCTNYLVRNANRITLIGPFDAQ